MPGRKHPRYAPGPAARLGGRKRPVKRSIGMRPGGNADDPRGPASGAPRAPGGGWGHAPRAPRLPRTARGGRGRAARMRSRRWPTARARRRRLLVGPPRFGWLVPADHRIARSVGLAIEVSHRCPRDREVRLQYRGGYPRCSRRQGVGSFFSAQRTVAGHNPAHLPFAGPRPQRPTRPPRPLARRVRTGSRAWRAVRVPTLGVAGTERPCPACAGPPPRLYVPARRGGLTLNVNAVWTRQSALRLSRPGPRTRGRLRAGRGGPNLLASGAPMLHFLCV